MEDFINVCIKNKNILYKVRLHPASCNAFFNHPCFFSKDQVFLKDFIASCEVGFFSPSWTGLTYIDFDDNSYLFSGISLSNNTYISSEFFVAFDFLTRNPNEWDIASINELIDDNIKRNNLIIKNFKSLFEYNLINGFSFSSNHQFLKNDFSSFADLCLYLLRKDDYFIINLNRGKINYTEYNFKIPEEQFLFKNKLIKLGITFDNIEQELWDLHLSTILSI